MNTRRMKIRRHLRSVRASVLSEEERRQELRTAEARATHHGSQDESTEPTVSPRTSGDGATPPSEAEAGRAGGGSD